jgi:hypothetical protein
LAACCRIAAWVENRRGAGEVDQHVDLDGVESLGDGGVDVALAGGVRDRRQLLTGRGSGNACREGEVVGRLDGGEDRLGGPAGHAGEADADHQATLRSKGDSSAPSSGVTEGVPGSGTEAVTAAGFG